MFDLLLADQNLIFAIALAVMLLLAVLEGVGVLLGHGLSHLFDQMMPSLHMDIDADMPEAPSALSRLLGWLRIGELPMLIVLVVFLTVFGLMGLGAQSVIAGITGALLPGWIIVWPVLIVSLPFTRWLSGGLGRIMPRDESTAVNGDELVGQIAVITLGEARVGSPSEARTRDQYGQTHYVMVEPLEPISIAQGQEVLLVQRLGSRYQVIPNPHSHLSSTHA
ncbi:YqiJ family protein [Pokkaliibacter sp. CJK22405]|uniref:YqiJ family protein n=1 Tax=Pokkaliibacter sp. CJK22405 TaxID=3384615 RepID=UPI003984CCC2